MQSVAAEINIFGGTNGGVGISPVLETNGSVPGEGTNVSNYIPVSPVVLNGGGAINVSLVYSPTAQTLTETLTDASNNTFTEVYTGVDLPSVLGANTAYVGFSGADGGEPRPSKSAISCTRAERDGQLWQ